VLWFTDDDVIENVNLEQLTGTNEVASEANIGFGWTGFTTWMIVHQDDRGCACDDCETENFSRMNENSIHRADGNQVMAFDAAARVEDKHDQTFAFRIEVWM